MQDIASAAGLHKSTLYHHFASKDEILCSICDVAFVGLEATLHDAETAQLDPGERLRAAFAGAARVAIENPDGTSVIISLQPTGPTSRQVIRRRRKYENRFAALVRAAQQAGEVRSDIDALLLARLALGMINALVVWFEPEGEYLVETVEEAVVSFAVQGWSERQRAVPSISLST